MAARPPTSPVSFSPAPVDQSLPTSATTDKGELLAESKANCLRLEKLLKESQDSLNKEWKDRIELEEQYDLEKKERLELEEKYNQEKKERMAFEEKFKLEQFNKTQLDARLAIAERELANFRKAAEAPAASPISQWPPQQPSVIPKVNPTAPTLIKTGGSGVGGFHSIKMRLAEAGIQ